MTACAKNGGHDSKLPMIAFSHVAEDKVCRRGGQDSEEQVMANSLRPRPRLGEEAGG